MDYEKAYKAVLKTATQWIKDGCTDKERICLESVLPELRESEDEKIRKELVNFILYKAGHLLDEDTEHKFIAYLEKQKPAEWSKEDEKNRRNLMSLLANMRGDRITEETYQKYYPWLKDLRSRPKPSDNWKPSDEQMGALNYAYCELFKREDVEHNILGPLQNLIDTLRKL